MYKKFIDFEETEIICLGHGDLKKEDIIKLCRENDKENDWSYGVADGELEAHANKWAEMNEELKSECPKYGIQYIDTSKDREKILQQILDNI